MPRILVLYYSSYGHTATMAEAIADGVRSAGAECDIRHVAETAPPDVVERAGLRGMEGHQQIEGPDALTRYDGIIVGTPTRYGRMASQMCAFWDQTGSLWASGALNNKVGAAFTSTASQHGGQETTLFSIITNLMHMGMTIVGLDYGYAGQQGVEEVKGGSPYGPTTIAGNDGSRQPSAAELDGCRYLGAKVARLTAKLSG